MGKSRSTPESSGQSKDNNSDTEQAGANPFTLAGGLLSQELRFALRFYPLLIAPQLFARIFDFVEPWMWILTHGLTRLFELIFFYVLGHRVTQAFRSEKTSFLWKHFSIYLLLGMSWSALATIPSQTLNPAISPSARMLLFCLLLSMYGLSYAYFFYFVPLLLGSRSISEGLALSSSYLQKDRLLPIKATLAPWGCLYLLQGLIAAVSPDGRLALVDYLSAITSEVHWILGAYLSLGIAFALLSEKDWHDFKLDPYRQSRFTTLSIRSPGWLRTALKPANGIQILVLSILVWAGNYARLSQMPPAAAIQLHSIEIQGNKVRLVIAAQDSEFSFRGFHPVQFRLAGSERKVIASAPSRAILEGDTRDVRFVFPQGKAAVTIHLTFEADREAAELQKLEDLYLWYGGARLSLLPMKTAQVLAQEPPQ